MCLWPLGHENMFSVNTYCSGCCCGQGRLDTKWGQWSRTYHKNCNVLRLWLWAVCSVFIILCVARNVLARNCFEIDMLHLRWLWSPASMSCDAATSAEDRCLMPKAITRLRMVLQMVLSKRRENRNAWSCLNFSILQPFEIQLSAKGAGAKAALASSLVCDQSPCLGFSLQRKAEQDLRRCRKMQLLNVSRFDWNDSCENWWESLRLVVLVKSLYLVLRSANLAGEGLSKPTCNHIKGEWEKCQHFWNYKVTK